MQRHRLFGVSVVYICAVVDSSQTTTERCEAMSFDALLVWWAETAKRLNSRSPKDIKKIGNCDAL